MTVCGRGRISQKKAQGSTAMWEIVKEVKAMPVPWQAN